MYREKQDEEKKKERLERDRERHRKKNATAPPTKRKATTVQEFIRRLPVDTEQKKLTN